MDIHDDNQYETNSPLQPINETTAVKVKPAKKRSWLKTLWGIGTIISVMINIGLFLMLILFIAFFSSAGSRSFYIEETVKDGPATNKIAIINVRGIIDGKIATEIKKQFAQAEKDDAIKGIIISINSPGGMVSASDNIHHMIKQYQQKTRKPVVAFMEGLAASGGYYVSVACEQIVAQPTTITGSIGVIMGHFVFEKLFEQKLGIQPIIIKSGPKKDWPTTFKQPTEEQIDYIREKLINPAYNRFVELIANGRPQLNLAEVKQLADGSIYYAQEALDKKLLDKIGYLDDAIALTISLAGIDKARVIEYQKPFSLSDMLSSKTNTLLNINRTTLYEITSPQLLYLWRP